MPQKYAIIRTHIIQVIHSSDYKDPSIFQGNKKVLIVGSGETGLCVCEGGRVSSSFEKLVCVWWGGRERVCVEEREVDCTCVCWTLSVDASPSLPCAHAHAFDVLAHTFDCGLCLSLAGISHTQRTHTHTHTRTHTHQQWTLRIGQCSRQAAPWLCRRVTVSLVSLLLWITVSIYT